MRKIIFIFLLSLIIISCGKKGSLEYPSQESHNTYEFESYLA